MTERTTAHEYERRRVALAEWLGRRRLIAGIVSSEANFTYLTGYLTPSWANPTRPMALVLGVDGSCTAVVSAAEAQRLTDADPAMAVEPYLEPVARKDENGAARADFSLASLQAVTRVLRPLGEGDVGVEMTPFASPTLPVHLVGAACAELGFQIEDIASALIVLRGRKSAVEVERLRAAGAALGAVFDRFAAEARAAATERELAATITRLAAEQGADRVGYAVVACDPMGSLLGRPRELSWRRGAILHVDVGLVLDGYWADFDRELIADDPSPEQARAYERITVALQAGFQATRAGVRARDVATAIAAELPPVRGAVFGRVGHGIGLELTEPPSLHLRDETPLESGMTLCIEPSAWFDGVGQLVAEEMVLVGEGLPERLSPPMPAQLVRVGG